MKLDQFLQVRRSFEIGFWIVLFSITCIIEIAIQAMDASRHGASTQVWEIVVWEFSSAFGILLLIPLLVYFDRTAPIHWSTFKRSLLAHLGFSVVFSVLHVSLMVLIRKFVYSLNDAYYDFGHIAEQFFYEYLKDARTYASCLALIYLYRHIIFRMQGEASLLAKNEYPSHSQDVEPERILIKKFGREFLIKTGDIEHIEAAGNYVNLHIDNRVYPLRETLTKMQQRLDESKFKRIHRSHIVNLNQVSEIRPFDSGDAQVLLLSGSKVPMSRTYRSQFLEDHG